MPTILEEIKNNLNSLIEGYAANQNLSEVLELLLQVGEDQEYISSLKKENNNVRYITCDIYKLEKLMQNEDFLCFLVKDIILKYDNNKKYLPQALEHLQAILQPLKKYLEFYKSCDPESTIQGTPLTEDSSKEKIKDFIKQKYKLRILQDYRKNLDEYYEYLKSLIIEDAWLVLNGDVCEPNPTIKLQLTNNENNSLKEKNNYLQRLLEQIKTLKKNSEKNLKEEIEKLTANNPTEELLLDLKKAEIKNQFKSIGEEYEKSICAIEKIIKDNIKSSNLQAFKNRYIESGILLEKFQQVVELRNAVKDINLQNVDAAISKTTEIMRTAIPILSKERDSHGSRFLNGLFIFMGCLVGVTECAVIYSLCTTGSFWRWKSPRVNLMKTPPLDILGPLTRPS